MPEQTEPDEPEQEPTPSRNGTVQIPGTQQRLEATVSKDRLLPKLRQLAYMAEDCQLHFREEELYVCVGDGWNTKRIEVRHPVAYETHFAPIVVGVRTQDLIETFRFTNQDSVLSLTLRDGDEDATVTEGNLMSYLSVLDPDDVRDTDTLSPRPWEFTTDVSLPARDLKTAVLGATGCGRDLLRISATPEGGLTAAGVDYDMGDFHEGVTVEAMVDGTDAKSVLGQTALADFITRIHPDTEVTIQMHTGHPVQFETDAGVRLRMAPRVEAMPNE